jgi:hypothetical protein
MLLFQLLALWYYPREESTIFHTQGCKVAYSEWKRMLEETLNLIKLMYRGENGKYVFLMEFCCRILVPSKLPVL